MIALAPLWVSSAVFLRAGRGAARRFQGTASSAAAPPVALFTAEACVGHDAGMGHPESPERLSHLLGLARTQWPAEFGDRLQLFEPEVEATEEQLLRVHGADYVGGLGRAFAASAERKAILALDSDTRVCPATAKAAYRASGLVVAAVDHVMGPGATSKRAFVMARPPGHHAEPGVAMGFCFFNHVMVGAAHAEAAYGKKRVAVLDFDVHHGNGDQAMCQGMPTRLYASSHQSPCYPGTGNIAGRSGSADNIINAPLKPGAGSAEFRAAWEDLILPAVEAFEPDAVLVSAGFDAHADDHLAQLFLATEDFSWVTRRIVEAARGAPIVSYLEGGYNIAALGDCVHAHIKALIETP